MAGSHFKGSEVIHAFLAHNLINSNSNINTNLTRVNILKSSGNQHCRRAMVQAVLSQFLWWEL